MTWEKWLDYRFSNTFFIYSFPHSAFLSSAVSNHRVFYYHLDKKKHTHTFTLCVIVSLFYLCTYQTDTVPLGFFQRVTEQRMTPLCGMKNCAAIKEMAKKIYTGHQHTCTETPHLKWHKHKQKHITEWKLLLIAEEKAEWIPVRMTSTARPGEVNGNGPATIRPKQRNLFHRKRRTGGHLET